MLLSGLHKNKIFRINLKFFKDISEKRSVITENYLFSE
jgi:hypothetical protein